MDSNEAAGGIAFLSGGVVAIIILTLVVVMIASMWKVFEKAGQPGWAALVPIYNLMVLLRIAGKPSWWLALFLIPFANFYALIMIGIALARNFGQSTGFGLGLVFLGFVFYPILAFGSARYQGPAGVSLEQLVTI